MFPHVLLITGYVATLETVYNSTFAVPGVLVLRLHEHFFYGSVAFEVYLDAILTTDVFETFGYSFSVWYYYLNYSGLVSWRGYCFVLCLGYCCLVLCCGCLPLLL